jgi:hypothetical protein
VIAMAGTVIASAGGIGRHGIGGDRLFGSTAQVLAATEADVVVPDRVPKMVL